MLRQTHNKLEHRKLNRDRICQRVGKLMSRQTIQRLTPHGMEIMSCTDIVCHGIMKTIKNKVCHNIENSVVTEYGKELEN